jgi:hypothetical protein
MPSKHNGQVGQVVDKSTSRLTSNYIKVSFYVETEERDQHSYSNIELK